MKTVFFLQSAMDSSNRAMLSGALRAVKSFGWQLRVLEFSRTSSFYSHADSSEDDLLTDVASLMGFWKPIGIIVDCGGLRGKLDKMRFALPTVFLDCNPGRVGEGSACVYSDAEEIGCLAARELLSLNMRSYAYAPFPVDTDWSIDRGRSFAKKIRLNHMPCHVFRKSAADALYARELAGWLASLPKPAGIFAANDSISELVVAAAQKSGFDVPNDIAVLGVDNNEPICMRSEPMLSSIKPDHEKAGFLAAQLLHTMVKNPRNPPASATFGVIATLHRASTRALRRHDERTMQILRTIREETTSGLSVSDLVAKTGVSRRTIEKQFREATGRSILQEIQSLRLEHAQLMLTQSSAQMKEIATSSGYPSTQSFRKHFKKAVGVSPVVFRRKNKASLG